MANRRSGTFDLREQTPFPAGEPVPHNDAEPFVARKVSAPLSLRARLTPQPGTAAAAPKRAAAR